MTDTPQPWERQPYESAADFAFFQFYIEQEGARSINEAFRRWQTHKGLKEAQKAPGSWRNLAAGKKRNGAPIPDAIPWPKRALAWDDYVADQERQKWLKRRLELREKEWDTGTKLLQRGQEMLTFPVVQAESHDGKTIIMPADWRIKDVPTILSTGSKLARLAAGLSTENIEVKDWRAEAQKEGLDVNDLEQVFNDLVEQYAARLTGSNDQSGNGASEVES